MKGAGRNVPQREAGGEKNDSVDTQFLSLRTGVTCSVAVSRVLSRVICHIPDEGKCRSSCIHDLPDGKRRRAGAGSAGIIVSRVPVSEFRSMGAVRVLRTEGLKTSKRRKRCHVVAWHGSHILADSHNRGLVLLRVPLSFNSGSWLPGPTESHAWGPDILLHDPLYSYP